MQPAGFQSALADRLAADLYRTNAFRVTGLAVEANDREISRHLERLRMAQRLGATAPDGGAVLPLTPPPSVEAVTEAAQRLRDPDARLLDRFFWFWSGEPTNDRALSLLRSGRASEAADAWRLASQNEREPTAHHNLAVLLHATASDLEHMASARPLSQAEEAQRTGLWKEALAAWRTICDLDRFWVLWDRMASNDSAMVAGLAAQFRPGLPEALLTINAQLAIAAARAGDQPRAATHGALMRQSGFDAPSVERAGRRAAQPIVHTITSLCAKSEVPTGEESSRSREAVDRLLADAAIPVGMLATILPRDHPLLNAAADQVLTRVQGLLVSYANSTRDWSGVLPLLARCFALPGGTTARARLQENIATLVGNIVGAQTENIVKGGSPPNDAIASLSKLAKWIEAVRKASYVSATACAELYESVAQAACSVSVAQFKNGDLPGASETLKFALTLASDPETRGQIEQGLQAIVNRRKQSSSNAAAGWIVAGLIGLGVLSSVLDSSKRGSTSTAGTRPSAGAVKGPRIPQRSSQPQLAQLEREIEQGKVLISQLERTLKQFDTSLSSSETEIEGYNAAIEQMERDANAGLEVGRSQYEALVAAQNQAVERHNATLARRRAKYAEYQTVLRDTNAKVDTYNGLIRR